MANPNKMPAYIRRLLEGDPPARSLLWVAIRGALLAPVGSPLSFFRAA